ncbi:hypothetical protein NITHO_3850011 [Nitrolancea hollandica Lb]|uniref:Uncharacterized protein n=1 Tax=Nitrolancea hollandica Lb TaxID=1129897 RepID=I4EJ74_9BACT|nr:hypothetical protein NITHO_3850011 [Nitrolancea hollandica Lb]
MTLLAKAAMPDVPFCFRLAQGNGVFEMTRQRNLMTTDRKGQGDDGAAPEVENRPPSALVLLARARTACGRV